MVAQPASAVIRNSVRSRRFILWYPLIFNSISGYSVAVNKKPLDERGAEFAMDGLYYGLDDQHCPPALTCVICRSAWHTAAVFGSGSPMVNGDGQKGPFRFPGVLA